MRTDLFDFELPEGNIALRPVSPRDAARMLVVKPGQPLTDSTVSELPLFLQPGDQLVVNGEGNLQIIDMLGRVVMTDQLTGSQSTTSLPTTAGVYVLRLTDTNGTRTQKMVIR